MKAIKNFIFAVINLLAVIVAITLGALLAAVVAVKLATDPEITPVPVTETDWAEKLKGLSTK